MFPVKLNSSHNSLRLLFTPPDQNTNDTYLFIEVSNFTQIPVKTLFGSSPPNINFLIISTLSLWLMIPGNGFFYSGLARSKSALTMIMLAMWSVAIVSIQWFVVGYSLAFSLTSGNPVIGNFDKVFLTGVAFHKFEEADVPEIAFCFYQGVTAALPTALIMGALAERARTIPALIFILIWTTFVYDTVAYWSLNPQGWSFKNGRKENYFDLFLQNYECIG
jgi:ammonia channel protein AmtB